MYETETVVRVTTKRGRVYLFSFDGDFSLQDYLNQQSFKIGKEVFLRIRKILNDDSKPDEIIVNINSVSLIKVEHEFTETY